MIEIPDDAVLHAVEMYPLESCGVIVAGAYIRCRNTAPTPEDHFRISPEDYHAALMLGEIEAIIHSHPNAPATPSMADRVGCEETAVPWAILSIVDRNLTAVEWVEPTGFVAPLIGRPFAHGVHDCAAVLFDYYERELGLSFHQAERDFGWWNRGENIYLRELPALGFERIPEGAAPTTGDIVLMQIRAPQPNHAGIYLETGLLTSESVTHPHPQCILHHLIDRESRRDTYGGYWADVTVGIWRYVGNGAKKD